MPSTMLIVCSSGNSATAFFFIARTIDRMSSPWMCSIAMKYVPRPDRRRRSRTMSCESVAAMRAS